VTVRTLNVAGERLNLKPPEGELYFDVKANLEEQERRNGQLTVAFSLAIGTKPGFARYMTKGTATLIGKDENIRKMLEIDPESKVPRVFYVIYQHSFTALYLLATVLNTPYPPPDLLHFNMEKIGVVRKEENNLDKKAAVEKTGTEAESREASSPDVEKKEDVELTVGAEVGAEVEAEAASR